MRKLATIRKIKELKPIKDADRIELAIIDGWQVVVKKGEFEVGQQCIYFEIDSFLPIMEQYEFLRKSSYRKNGDGTEGFRLKSIRLKGELSQGLALPIENPELKLFNDGDDVTEILGVTKWEPPIPASLSGKVIGGFPGGVRKTDEERVQNLEDSLDEWKRDKIKFYISEKLDGTSATFYLIDGEFGVCGRNWCYQEDDINTYWKVARQIDIEAKLRDHCKNVQISENLVVQGEIIGESIQKNLYKLKGQDFYMFNMFYPDSGQYSMDAMERFSEKYDIKLCPVLHYFTFSETNNINWLLKMAEGKSKLNPDQEREGLVFKSEDYKHHFKVISNKFLLKHED